MTVSRSKRGTTIKATGAVDQLLFDRMAEKVDSRLVHAAALLQSLQSALKFACDQLDGWVNWKCPEKHRPEHRASIGKLRALAGL